MVACIAVVGLLTIRIDNGEDVEVICIQDVLHFLIALISVKQGEGNVFGHHRGDPLASMDRSVEDNRGILASSTAAKEVDTGDGTVLGGFTVGLNGLSIVRVLLREIRQELNVIVVWVVRVEPSVVCVAG